MALDTVWLTELIEVAAGKRPADLCLRGGQLVNVFTGHVVTQDLAIHRGHMVGWGDYEARQDVDLGGAYVSPGFIDGHIHLESTLLSPAQFCAAVLPHGTTAVVADPHEIANVLGLAGIDYFLAATEGLLVDIFFNLPSCVPACPLETSGAVLRASDLFTRLPHPRVLGLAEMMNFPGVLAALPDVLDKLTIFQDVARDGHAPQLSGLPLNGYLAAGIGSDHECTTLAEAREKLAKGMAIMIREGSQSQDLEALLPVVDEHTWPRCMLVSDDRHPDDLVHSGHLNVAVNRAMASGLEPVRALTLATWTPAQIFRLPRRGAVAPGYVADLQVSPTLNPWTPTRVFKGGLQVARDGRLLADPASWPRPPAPPSPMRMARVVEEDLVLPARSGKLRVIRVLEGTLLTREVLVDPRVGDGRVLADVDRDILKLVVCNRYQHGRKPALGFVQGFGLKRGAIASTVAHDAHNLIAAGTDDAALVRVMEAVRAAGGGLAIGAPGGPLHLLPLPVAGLMSELPVAEVCERLAVLRDQAHSWGATLVNPFMALSFLALAVIPELKLTDLGLVDVRNFALVPPFKEE
jgi:adenine deaminase